MINKAQRQAGNYEGTVEGAKYKQEADYFVLYVDSAQTKKLLTVKASSVSW